MGQSTFDPHPNPPPEYQGEGEILRRKCHAPMPNQSRQPLLYVLHSSKLHGTERVALDTARGLADEFEPILFGPPGPAMEEAERLGFEARRFSGAAEFAKSLCPAWRDIHP